MIKENRRLNLKGQKSFEPEGILEDKGELLPTVLITGGSRGIGAAMSRAFFTAGWNVAINYRQRKAAALALWDELQGSGLQHGGNPERCPKAVPRAGIYQADVGNARQVKEMTEQITAELGPVLCLINNAGIAQQKLFTDLTEKEWDEMFDIHVKGAFFCTQAVLPEMIRRQEGVILNISSMWGQVGGSCEVHYSAAKAALIGLTKALAKELGPSGVRVNCLAPGLIKTEMNAALKEADLSELSQEIPLGRIGLPEEVASLALFLASPAASYITGQVLGVNGGFVL